jgi:hypothetical protein
LNFDETATVICLGCLDSEPWERESSNRRLPGEQEAKKQDHWPGAPSSRTSYPWLIVEHSSLDSSFSVLAMQCLPLLNWAE